MKKPKHDFATCMCHVRFGRDNSRVIRLTDFVHCVLLGILIMSTISLIIYGLWIDTPPRVQSDADVMCKTLFGKDYKYLVIDENTACVNDERGAFVLPRNTTLSNKLQEIGGYPVMAWPVDGVRR